MTREVTIVEVGPRDGLQNESVPVPTDIKIAFINALSLAGLPIIESTSFVNPRLVPQMADAAEVLAGITRYPGVAYPALVPNATGMERAIEAKADSVAFFTAATEAFCQANINCSIDESLLRLEPILASAREHDLPVRGYVSVAFNCPYTGRVAAVDALSVAKRLFDAGCSQICLADTLGSATSGQVETLLTLVLADLPASRLALHLHDTYGQAIDNVATGFEMGIRIFDSAAGGLGGCPFAPGAAGNLATESLVEYFESRGVATGIDLIKLQRAVSLLTGFTAARSV